MIGLLVIVEDRDHGRARRRVGLTSQALDDGCLSCFGEWLVGQAPEEIAVRVAGSQQLSQGDRLGI